MTDSSFILPAALVLAWILDLIFGDPASLPHPVVWFGRWIAFCERRFNSGAHRKAKGAVVAVTSIVFTFSVAYAFLYIIIPGKSQTVCSPLLWGGLGVEAVLIFFCLAGHTLRKEVRLVFDALDRSLDEGRRQVSRIVGRDTAQLSANDVRTAALETLAENLSDGVIAPLFWLCLFGVPGMIAYKMINTLDSMIGYRNERYKDFGCWAARIDDVANYIPARLTALLMVLAGWLYTRCPSLHTLIPFVITNGSRHASPNSGWPEAALAGILDCRFGGTHNYFGETFYKPYIGVNPRSLTIDDMRVSVSVCLVAECLAVALTVFMLLLI